MSNIINFDITTNPDYFKACRLIGCGGYGEVIEIVHLPTGRHFAGKILRKLSIDEKSLENIKNEISMMQSIRNDNIINYYGIINFPKENPHYIVVLDYCDRGSLRDILNNTQKTLNEDQISIVMHDILLAVSYLHDEHKIYHSDIKAANILMSSDTSIKLSDFGLSKKIDNSEENLTISGSPYWMAPEVILAEKHSFPADIWSIGITAVELHEGRPPFYEYPSSRAMNEIISLGFPGFRDESTISPQFADFVKKCCQIRPNQRPKASQLLDHPFIKQSEKLDRKQIFKDLLQNETNFNDLIDSEDFDELQKFIHFENIPKISSKTNFNEKKEKMISCEGFLNNQNPVLRV